MTLQRVVDRVYRLPIRQVNVYLLETEQGLVLIDTGYEGSAPAILQAIRSLGCESSDLRTILLTHAHPDHAGSLGALKQEVPDVRIYASEQDISIVSKREKQRTIKPAPGLLNAILFRILIRGDGVVEPAPLDGVLQHGKVLDFAGGLQAIFTPGHSYGHFAFLLPSHGGVLFAGDLAANMSGLNLNIGYEHLEQGLETLRMVGQLDYEIACFGHGNPIMKQASARFRAKWPS
ncbi:MBL fold metallo-hydrolase [Paenibacillus sp. CCS19]|uniref:MBL fold metallo-hydrolase n=1 Tax=Paenibacillus sp. CCS19 TaxID=3158387 RepID=UPI00256CA7E6|nr:MBL fold metallo-hydrolase [Paenibacillus cellulosilyticus]GMK37271.1 MBL fold metallo-hydrolase [Paenibacillus cellulosilyticus]